MPYRPHTLVTFRGHMGPSLAEHIETWSFGLRFGVEDSEVGVVPVTSQAFVDACKTAFNTQMQSTGMKFISQAWFDECRGYPIGADGKAQAQPVISTNGTGVNGTSAAPHPWQCAMAVSLTAEGLGKGKRGRFYLPPSAQLILNTGQINGVDQTALVTGMTSFANSLNTAAQALAAGLRLAIAGGTGEQGTLRTVRHVAVGSVMDTQRRRRRQLKETRQNSDGAFGEAPGGGL